ncbi:hypothetical protein Y032_0222g2646 [Ancylostoma ceylanicum]|nr:hypothetical protein Y032_0222g2646 [Ancylostoma ceylanicum]
MATKRRGNLTSPLGRHKVEAHGGNDFDIKCKILAYEDDISARKALEAAWIFTRNPGMNIFEDDSTLREEEDDEDVNKVEELATSEELHSVPVVTTGGDNAEAKNLQLSKKRGHAIRRRRLMDCCTVL